MRWCISVCIGSLVLSGMKSTVTHDAAPLQQFHDSMFVVSALRLSLYFLSLNVLPTMAIVVGQRRAESAFFQAVLLYRACIDIGNRISGRQ